MSSLVPTIVNADASPDPTTPLQLVGSIMYDWEEGSYNLEWGTRAEFENWLTHEQKALGIEIRQSKTHLSKARKVYLTCKTFHCAHNRCRGLKHYKKKTARERKIDSKWINGRCPCYIQIKTYPLTNTVLGKYKFNHSHETRKNNLKYIWIWVSMWDLIEDWVQYGVTNEEIVSDPLCDHY